MDGLLKSPVFAGLSIDTVISLTQKFPRKKYKKDEIILRQGDPGVVAHLLVDGKVEVYYQSKEGLKTTIIYHEAPFAFGEIELWDNMPYLAYVVAIEPCETLVMTAKDYLSLLHSHHQVCINLIRLLSRLLYETGEDRRVRFFGQIDHLLANILCSFAQLYGKEHRYGILIQKDINKSEIAEILGVSRKSVIQAFRDLSKEKLIELKGKQLAIPDLALLQKKARSL